MKTIALLILAAANLFAQTPIGLSIPIGGEPVFSDKLPAIRYAAFLKGESKGIAQSAKENGTEIVAVIHADIVEGNTSQPDAWRRFFVGTMVTNYGKSVTNWEILPPADLDPRHPESPFRYVQLLTLAHKAARDANPAARTGISVANYDLEFLDATLRDGAVGQFDFVSLSPFPVSAGTDRLMPGALAAVRKLMTLHGLPAETPVHITLTGPEALLVMTAASARAAGFDRIFIEADAKTLAGIPDKCHADIPKSRADSPAVSLNLGETNQSDGLEQILPSDTPWDDELKANRLALSATPPVFRTAFLADPTFLDPERKTYEITVEAKRLPSDDGLQNPTALNLTYEASHGLRTAVLWPVPGDNKWQTHTWKIDDARFTAKLGWHFRLDASGSGNDVLIREVKVAR
jgi:hypothetical protein